MKANIITLILLFTISCLYSQEHDYDVVLATDSTWGHEFFEFPIGFAQAINYEGLEDASFPPGWSKQESDEFWSYVFAWDIKLDKEVSVKELEQDLNIYFDGLMKLNEENKNNKEVEKTITKLLKEDSSNNLFRFKGEIQTLNAFHTQKAMTLNVTVEQYLCESKNNSVIIFRFSPKGFEAKIWQKLEGVKIKEWNCGL